MSTTDTLLTSTKAEAYEVASEAIQLATDFYKEGAM